MEPCIYDFSVASIMAGVHDNTLGTWLTGVAYDYPGLKTYTDRVLTSVGVYGRHL